MPPAHHRKCDNQGMKTATFALALLTVFVSGCVSTASPETSAHEQWQIPLTLHRVNADGDHYRDFYLVDSNGDVVDDGDDTSWKACRDDIANWCVMSVCRPNGLMSTSMGMGRCFSKCMGNSYQRCKEEPVRRPDENTDGEN